MQLDESQLIKAHQPCPNTKDCGSSDAYSIYSDGHGWCYSCHKYFKEDMEVTDTKKIQKLKTSTIIRTHGEPGHSINSRNIKKATCDKFGVEFVRHPDNPNKLWKQLYPYYNKNGKKIAIKVRTGLKSFHTEGDFKSDILLFGQTLWPKGGKYLTITEGELDAMSAYELLGSKYPVVSIPNGTDSVKKTFQKKSVYDFCNSFETIVICFDGDEPGIKAAKEVALVFPPTKLKVVFLKKYKDANEYLVAKDYPGFTQEWWRMESCKPDGIVAGLDVWDRLTNRPEVYCFPLPWEKLNELTYGARLSEMWTITGGSGMGKTAVLRELCYHLLKTTEFNIGGIFLEETVIESAEGLMSIHASKPFHLPTTERTDEEYKEAFDHTLGTDRIFYYDHFGSTSISNIIDRVRYLASALECKIIFLDHISILVSDQQNSDERKALDEIATKLKTICMELGVLLIIVSHSKRTAGKPHEEGGVTSLSELRGTAAIGQLSNMVLGLERNGQDEDLEIRNKTLIRVLKNRFSGETGPSSYLLYSKFTGRLKEVNNDIDMDDSDTSEFKDETLTKEEEAMLEEETV
jgi:twinkle protein